MPYPFCNGVVEFFSGCPVGGVWNNTEKEDWLVHGSHLKQKKFVGTKSLGITPS